MIFQTDYQTIIKVIFAYCSGTIQTLNARYQKGQKRELILWNQTVNIAREDFKICTKTQDSYGR